MVFAHFFPFVGVVVAVVVAVANVARVYTEMIVALELVSGAVPSARVARRAVQLVAQIAAIPGYKLQNLGYKKDL